MPFVNMVLRDRRVWLVGALAVVCIVLGRWVVSPLGAIPLVAKAGYWFLLATFGLFGWSLWRLAAPALRGWRPVRADWGALALVVACWGLWMAHEKPGYKILADEVLLTATSMGMHYEREVAMPVRATDVRGPWQFPEKMLDKRPYFFPFLVSLAHDLTGYRPANAFAVNAALGLLFLGLVYAIGRRIGGTRWTGSLLVLLFAGLPLLAQQSLGGGFELLNIVMMATVLLLGWRYLDSPDDDSLAALCLAAVLLAFTRYESVVFVVPVAGLALAGWYRAGRVVLPWPVALAPLWLLPYLLQNRVFSVSPDAWQMASKPGITAPFSLDYLPANLGHALAFFFDTSGYQANAIYFAALGLLALPFFLLLVVRWLREPRATGATELGLAWWSVGLVAIGALLMVYFWGQFDDPVIRRLSLPVHLLLAAAVAVIGAGLVRRFPWGWRVLTAGAVVALFFVSLPMMVRNAYFWEYRPGLEMAWRKDFLERQPRRDFLFIDRDQTFWITERVPATPIQQAAERREALAYHLRNHSFSAMYVFQRFTVDDQTGALVLEPKDDVGPGYVLEPVEERRIATLYLSRISRVTAIKEGDEVVARARPYAQESAAPRSDAELRQAEARYLERWIKNLP